MSNRDIKFRAWSNELEQYFYAPSDSWSLVFHDTGNLIQMWCSDGLVDEIPVDVIEQFTGLTDKNGNEIYEGDIVKNDTSDLTEVRFYIEDIGSCGCCYSVFDGSGFAAFDDNYSGFYLTECEVIGNIHQNPELLEQSQ